MGLFKLLVEAAPLLTFFIAFKLSGLIMATSLLVVVTLITVAIMYYRERKLPLIPLISAAVLTIFGLLTIHSGDTIFIKLKPTILNSLLGLTLLIGAMRKKGLMKHLFGQALVMEEGAWVSFSIRWGIFFLFLSMLNEAVWRNFPEETWVNFKVFGLLPLTILFSFTQIPFLMKNRKD